MSGVYAIQLRTVNLLENAPNGAAAAGTGRLHICKETGQHETVR